MESPQKQMGRVDARACRLLRRRSQEAIGEQGAETSGQAGGDQTREADTQVPAVGPVGAAGPQRAGKGDSGKVQSGRLLPDAPASSPPELSGCQVSLTPPQGERPRAETVCISETHLCTREGHVSCSKRASSHGHVQ